MLNLINDLAHQKMGQNAAPARDPAQEPLLVGRAGGRSGLRLSSLSPEDSPAQLLRVIARRDGVSHPFSTPLPLALGSKLVCQVCSQAWGGSVVECGVTAGPQA